MTCRKKEISRERPENDVDTYRGTLDTGDAKFDDVVERVRVLDCILRRKE